MEGDQGPQEAARITVDPGAAGHVADRRELELAPQLLPALRAKVLVRDRLDLGKPLTVLLAERHSERDGRPVVACAGVPRLLEMAARLVEVAEG